MWQINDKSSKMFHQFHFSNTITYHVWISDIRYCYCLYPIHTVMANQKGWFRNPVYLTATVFPISSPPCDNTQHPEAGHVISADLYHASSSNIWCFLWSLTILHIVNTWFQIHPATNPGQSGKFLNFKNLKTLNAPGNGFSISFLDTLVS